MTATADRARLIAAIGLLFFVNGFGWASWIPRIPEVQEALGLDVAALGLVLAATGVGGLTGSLTGGAVIDRYGSRAAAGAGALATAGALALLPTAPSAVALGVVVFVIGVVDAVADMAMNVQAADLQRDRGAWIMNRFHATWSTGTLLGAAAGSLAARLGLSLTTHLTVTALGLIVAVVWAVQQLPPVDHEAAHQPNRRITAPAVVLGLLAFAVAMPESAAGDWAAVFMRDVHGYSPGGVGLAFVGFSAGMLTGRWAADRVVERRGAVATVAMSAVLAAAGITVAALSPAPEGTIAGFALQGIGLAALFPMLYNAAASRATTSAGTGLALMTTGGRLGFVVGPVVIGQLAGAFDIRVGYATVTLAAVIVVLVLSRRFGD